MASGIDGTTVSKSLDVLGNVDAQKAQINHIRILGNAYLDTTTATSLMDVTGNVRASDFTIVGPATVVGYFHGKQATFNSTAHIVGTLVCENCIFNDDATLIGDIKASNTKFLRNILLNANKSQFYHSSVNDIAVKKPSDNQDQTIELSDSSIVNNIIFESGKGVVILNGGSKITGSVKGGKVITKSS
jgi:hypothetical protein